ncbi:MAG TPA: hypothetical protein VMZ33_06180 [Candidatus Limnocylindrales bacterium]|nr:hypothetical protein [Candidatus Limnocylindrales bacterium]
MTARFDGLWLGIVVIAGASFLAIVLGLLLVDFPSRVVIGLLWLGIASWFAWGMWRSRIR